MTLVPTGPIAEFESTRRLKPTLLDKHYVTGKRSDSSQLVTPSIACAGSSPTAANSPGVVGHHVRVANVGVPPKWEEEGWRVLFDTMGLRQTGVDKYDCLTVAAESPPEGTHQSPEGNTASVPSEVPNRPDFAVQSRMAVDVPPQGNFQQLDNVTLRNLTSPNSPESIAPDMALDLGTQLGHDMVNNRHNAHTQFDTSSLFCKLGEELPVQTQSQPLRPQASYAGFSQVHVPPPVELSYMSIQPGQASLKKHKKSQAAVNDGHDAKRRAAPSVSNANIPRLFQTLAQQHVLQQQLDQTPSPLLPGDSSDTVSKPTPHTYSSPSADDKPYSTARPKSVVPDRFLNDGSAEAALGMNIERIQSFPTFEALLKKVHPSLFVRAQKFGEKIAKARERANIAGKRSRDQKRVKLKKAEELEKKMEELEAQVWDLKLLLLQLVEKGLITKDVVGQYL